MSQTSRTTQASWEYFGMPQKKEVMAGYIRESDERLADSVTIESQANAVRQHGVAQGYLYPPENEFREAISAYMVPYNQRKKLLEMLEAAKHKRFNVLVVSEIRALGRKQVEIFVIYDILQKYGVRLETIQEKFEDSAIGRFILSTRALVAELERENTFMRTQRGKHDRLAGGAVNGHPYPAYGYILVDTDRETSAVYQFNEKIIFVDDEGTEWSEIKIVRHIFDLILSGWSTGSVATYLTERGFPTPKKPRKYEVPVWWRTTILKIISKEIYAGIVYANKTSGSGKKRVKCPKEEWVRLADAPAIITPEQYDLILRQLVINKEDSLKNNNQRGKDLGILRAGYCLCGVCGSVMRVRHTAQSGRTKRFTAYACCRKELTNKHAMTISLVSLDKSAWEKAVEHIKHPEWVRALVTKLREENKAAIDSDGVEETIAKIVKQMKNLFAMAQNAEDDDALETLMGMYKNLEKQKQQAEAMLDSFEDDAEERAEIEQELQRFEEWAQRVRPDLTNPDYVPTYEEQRLAIRILGIKAWVYPASDDRSSRVDLDVTIPEVLGKLAFVKPPTRLQPGESKQNLL